MDNQAKRTQQSMHISTQKDIFTIAGQHIGLGEKAIVELPIAKLYTSTNMHMPIQVIRAKKSGPRVFVSAAVHGDEINGIEIIRKLIKRKLSLVKGTLILVPIVNVYGVIDKSRYMPDRRDLNRSFPGYSKGSLASRVAYQFFNEIVKQCDYGIDLHTGAIHRSNLPQIRINLKDEKLKELAMSFGVPVVLNANLIDGSLRQSGSEGDCRILLYEGGEALRFDELSIRAGMRGVINTLTHLGMLRKSRSTTDKFTVEPIVANKSSWMRATESGLVNFKAHLGDRVAKNQLLANIMSPFGEVVGEIHSSKAGIIIGKQNIPLVQEGEAMYHIAYFDELDEIEDNIEYFEDSILPDS